MIDILKNRLEQLLNGNVYESEFDNNNDDDKPLMWHLIRFYYYDIILERIIPDELEYPVEDRESGIDEAISILLSRNSSVDEDFVEQNPLSFAVEFVDPLMVEYLINHGANCRKCIWNEEAFMFLVADGEASIDDFDPDDPCNNDYLASIDGLLCDSGSKSYITDIEKYRNNLLKIATIIVKAGKLWPFRGSVLKVDENKIIADYSQVDKK